MMVVVGQKVRFDPFEYFTYLGVKDDRCEVTGEIAEVNYAHKWFSVEYGQHKQRTSFHFCDIGKLVSICGRC